MADVGWSWSDLGSAGSFGAVLLTLAGYLHMSGKKTAAVDDAMAKADEAKNAADGAKSAADKVAIDLAAYKLTASEKFVPREQIEHLESKILQRMDKQDERFDASITRLVERIDRVFTPKSAP
jgi:hypothetical protein